MKHLKLFEGYGYENKEISDEEWYELVPITITDKISSIRNFIDKWSYDLSGDFSSGFEHRAGLNLYRIDYNGGKYYKLVIQIQACEDEWFKVILAENKNSSRIRKMYKCDQMGGLLEFLDETFKKIPPYTPISI